MHPCDEADRAACGGWAGICEHKRIKTQCRDCGGPGICEHKRRRSRCKDCGSAFHAISPGMPSHTSRVRLSVRACDGGSVKRAGTHTDTHTSACVCVCVRAHTHTHAHTHIPDTIINMQWAREFASTDSKGTGVRSVRVLASAHTAAGGYRHTECVRERQCVREGGGGVIEREGAGDRENIGHACIHAYMHACACIHTNLHTSKYTYMRTRT